MRPIIKPIVLVPAKDFNDPKKALTSCELENTETTIKEKIRKIKDR
jgi:hypothetical protein